MAWSDILGQEFVKRLWQTHLSTGQVAGAYLLVGPDGVGKRRLALELARALNCTASQKKPCDVCPTCGQISRGTHPDVHVVLSSGASDQIKIDQIRHIIGRIALRPFSAAFQVVIIDGAERLTEEAANSLLKALEEPSAHTRFVLTTTRLSDCLPTIVSRCQLMRCHPLAHEAVQRILIEQHSISHEVAEAGARLSGGSVSLALDLATRWTAYERLMARFADERDPSWLAQPLPETRQEVMQLLDGMMVWLRDLAVTAVAQPGAAIQTAHEASLRRQAKRLDIDRCLETASELVALRESVEQFVSPRLVAAIAREKWLSLVESTRG